MKKHTLLKKLTICLMFVGSPSAVALEDNETINLLAFGDGGFLPPPGNKTGMTIVGTAMQEYCSTIDCHFGLVAGDNIYPKGAVGDPVKDALTFNSRFNGPYGGLKNTHPDFRLYFALGNHDWATSRQGALAQEAYLRTTEPFYMDGFFYTVKPPRANGAVELFIVDTEMLLSTMSIPRYKLQDDGSMLDTGNHSMGGNKMARPQNAAEKNQLQWLETSLKNSTAPWKIVVAHHPLWQSKGDSKYTQSIALRDLMLPMLCTYADVYVAGHQHTLEVQQNDCKAGGGQPLLQIVSGTAAKSRTVDEKFSVWQASNYPELTTHFVKGGIWGFSHMAIDGDKLSVKMLEVDGKGEMKEIFEQSFTNRGIKVNGSTK